MLHLIDPLLDAAPLRQPGLTDAHKTDIRDVLDAWQAADDEGCGCRYGIDWFDAWYEADGEELLLTAVGRDRALLSLAEDHAILLLALEAADEA